MRKESLSEKLVMTNLKNFEGLNAELKKGLERLYFTEEHEALVEKIIQAGVLTTQYLDKAGDGLMSNEQIDEIYELQNILLTSQDLKDLAVVLFGSMNSNKEGLPDKDSWFWKLVDPTSQVPHIKQANVMAGRYLAERLKNGGEILDCGAGGGDSIVAIIEALKEADVDLEKINYTGVDGAVTLIEYLKNIMAGGAPEYIKNDAEKYPAFEKRASLFKKLGKSEAVNDDFDKYIEGVADNSLAVVTFGYVLHHFKSGEAIVRAISEGRLKIDGEKAYFVPKNGEAIEIELETLNRTLLDSFGEDHLDKIRGILSGETDMLESEALREMVKNPQLDLLKKVFTKMKEGGSVIIADPSEGKSNFNKSVIIKDAEGFADFTSLGIMSEMLKKAGFENINGFQQWGISTEYYNANKEKFEGLDIEKKSFDGGKTILGYIVAIPHARIDKFEDTEADKYLGYYVTADKPKNKPAVTDVSTKVKRVLGEITA